jgi:hypothetical protein
MNPPLNEPRAESQSYSITSSAIASSVLGMAMPRALAVLRVDDQLELGRLRDRQLGRLRALEDATGIDAHLTVRIDHARSVAHQPASFDILTTAIRGGERIVRRRLELIRSGWRRGSACSRKNIKQIHLRGFFSSITPHVAAAVIPPSATSSKTSSGVPIGVIRRETLRLRELWPASFHKLLFMHLDCRVLAACGCPLLSCSRNMAKLRYGFTYIF